jgi:hypothetical protein
VSPSIIVLAIVATWAVFLVPRWVRRPQMRVSQQPAEQDESGWYDEHGADGADEDHDESVSDSYDAGSYEDDYRGAPDPADDSADPARRRPVAGSRSQEAAYRRPVPAGRSRVLQARRRMLTILVLFAAAAGAVTYLKLASWWVCVPPAVLLGIYLLLLREAALADAEQARWRAEEARRAFAARQGEQAARAASVAAASKVQERTAEIIDISARIGDQLYDQYADAAVRAVGD